MSEFRVNTFTDNAQTLLSTLFGVPNVGSNGVAGQALGMDANGNFVVAWTSDGQDGDGLGVYFQRFNANGQKIDANGNVLPDTAADITPVASPAADQALPSVGMSNAVGASRHFVVTWTGFNQAGEPNSDGIYYRVYNPDGTSTAQFRANQTIVGNQRHSVTAMDKNGNFVIAWASQGQDGNGWGVYARRFGPDGVSLSGPEFLVNDPSNGGITQGDQANVKLAMSENGDYVIVWHDPGTTTGTGRDVYARIFRKDGTSSNAFAVANASGEQTDPTVAIDSNGTIVVAWSALDGSDTGIFSRRITYSTTDGTAIAPTLTDIERVNTTTFNRQGNAAVAMNTVGDYVISWMSETSSGNFDVFYQRFKATGTRQQGETRLNSTTAGSQRFPSVGMDASGQFAAIWASATQDPDGSSGIYAEIVPAPLNSSPVITDFPKTGIEDQLISFSTGDFQAVFSDPDNADADPSNDGVLTRVQIKTLPTWGTLRLNGFEVSSGQLIATADLNNLTYTPQDNYNGPDSFTWNASDGIDFASQDRRVNITLAPRNDAPGVLAVTITGEEDTPTPITLTQTNFSDRFNDIDADILLNQGTPTSPRTLTRIRFSSLPADGTLQLNGAPVVAGTEYDATVPFALTYAPAPNVNGTRILRWEGFDGTAWSTSSATVTFNILSVNDAAIAASFTKSVDEETLLQFVSGDFPYSDDNPPGDIQIRVTSLPANGKLFLNGVEQTAPFLVSLVNVDNLDYRGNVNFTGQDTFQWQVFDGQLNSETQTATINVNPVNDIPNVNAVAIAFDEDTIKTFAIADFQPGFNDPEGDPLSSIQIVTLPDAAAGVLKLGATPIAAGTTITVGQLGNLTFEPALNRNGDFTFTWRASDPQFLSANSAEATLRINPVNDRPTVTSFAKTVAEDAPLNFSPSDFSNRFTDVDGETLQRVQITDLPDQGKLFVNGVEVTLNQILELDDLGLLTYQSNPNYNGPDSFQWTGQDGIDYAVSAATVNLTVTEVNDAPTVGNIARTIDEDAEYTFLVTDFGGPAVYTDPENNPLTGIRVVSLPAGELMLGGIPVTANQIITVSELANATLKYKPALNSTTPASFTWQATDDGILFSAVASVDVTITPLNDPPTVSTVGRAIAEDSAPIAFTAADFISGFSDPDSGDSLSKIRITALPMDGTGILRYDGTPVVTGQEILVADLNRLTYDVPANFDQTATFKWNAADGNTIYGATEADFNITITPNNNDAPSVTNVLKTTPQDVNYLFKLDDFGAAFTDPDTGDGLFSITITALPTVGGTLLLGATPVTLNQVIPAINIPTLVFNPTPGYNGNSTFSWSATDRNGIPSTGTATVTIDVGNDPPVLSGDLSKSTNEDDPIGFSLAEFNSVYSDGDGNPLAAVKLVSLPTQGRLFLNETPITSANVDIPAASLGQLRYVANSNPTGSDAFRWTASDGIVFAAGDRQVIFTVTPQRDVPSVGDVNPGAIDEEGSITFAATDFSNQFTAPDFNNVLQQVRITALPTKGKLFLNGIEFTDTSQLLSVASLDQLRYVGALDQFGSDSFGWVGADASGFAPVPGSVNITINGVNDRPIISDTTAIEISEDAARSLALTDFTTRFTDPDSPLIKIRITELPTKGRLFLNSTELTAANLPVLGEILAAEIGNLRYEANPNSTGADSFRWNASDEFVYAENDARFNLTIAEIRDVPTVSDLTPGAIDEEGAIDFTAAVFEQQFIAPDFNNVLQQVRITALPTKGKLFLNGTLFTDTSQILSPADLNQLRYVGDLNEFGGDFFQWLGADAGGFAATPARVNITINPVNDRPEIVDITGLQVEEDDSLVFQTSDFAAAFNDADSTLNAIRITALPSKGTLFFNGTPLTAIDLPQTIAAGDISQLRYEVNPNQIGPDSFGWTASDGQVDALTPATVRLTIANLRDIPTVNDVVKGAIAEDSEITFSTTDFTSQFTAPDYADTLVRIQIVSLPTLGRLELDGNVLAENAVIEAADLGRLRYIATANLSGEESFQWLGADQEGFAATPANVRITLNSVNDLPTLTNITGLEVAEDAVQPFVFQSSTFTSAFTDVDGSLTSIQITSLPTKGTLFLDGIALTSANLNTPIPVATIGQLSYLPNSNASGADEFGWNASDGEAIALTPATVTLTIGDVRDIPTAASFDKGNLPEEGTLPFTAADFANNFIAPDFGNTLTRIQITGLPTKGKLRLNETEVALNQELLFSDLGNLFYVGNLNATGPDGFQWQGGDALGYSAPASVVLNLTNVNDAPTLTPVTTSIPEDTVLDFSPTLFQGGFADADGESFTQIRIVTLPGNGTLTRNGTLVAVNEVIPIGELTALRFTPNPDFSGSISFSWNGADGSNTFAAADSTFTLTVQPTRDLPIAANLDGGSINEDATRTFSPDFFAAGFTAPDNDNVLTRIQITALPTQGTLLLNGTPVTLNAEIDAVNLGNLVYRPNDHYFGTDSFSWNGRDTAGYGATAATVAIAIASVNDKPVLSDITVNTLTEGDTFTFSEALFRTGFSDVENGTAFTRVKITSLPAANEGVLKLNGSAIAPNDEIDSAQLGGLVFEPLPNFNGSVSFTWNASDGADYADADRSVTLVLASVPDLPTISDVVIPTFPEDTPTISFSSASFLSSFSDDDGDTLTKIQITSLPTKGTLRLNGVDVRELDEIDIAAIGDLRYLPNANANGSDEFAWNGFDGSSYAAQVARVRFDITPVNDAPTVSTINQTISEDSPFTFSESFFSAAFNDVDSEPLTRIIITALPASAAGQLRFNNIPVTVNQSFLAADLERLTFVPATNFNGVASFNWNGRDSLTFATTGATVNLTVTATNDLPIVTAFNKAVTEDTPVTFTVSEFQSAYSDIDNDALQRVRIQTLPTRGTLRLNGLVVTEGQDFAIADVASLQYSPNLNATGSDSFLWTASDGTGFATAAVAVNLAIAPVNDPPTGSTLIKGAPEGTDIPFTTADFTASVSDPDPGDGLTAIRLVAAPTSGTLKLNGVAIATFPVSVPLANLNQLTYTPAPFFNGAAEFSWLAVDGSNAEAATPAKVLITVGSVPDAPTAGTITKTQNEDVTVIFSRADFVNAFSDPDAGDQLVNVQFRSLPSRGTFTINGGAVALNQDYTPADLDTLVYVPPANNTDTITFDWVASDGTLYSLAPGRVNLVFTAVNDAPSVGNITPPAIDEDTGSITFNPGTFTGSYNDPDGDPLQTVRISPLPSKGTLIWDGRPVTDGQEIPADQLDRLIYRPNPDADGEDSFGWQGSDGTAYADPRGQVIITITPVNDLPVVNTTPLVRTIDEDGVASFTATDFTSRVTDSDPGDTLQSITLSRLPAQGRVLLNGTALTQGQSVPVEQLERLTYVPNLNINGSDSFEWRASDGKGLSTTVGTVNLTITPVNDAPTLSAIDKTGVENQAIALLATDFTGAYSDPEANPLVKILIADLPDQGTLALNGTPVDLNQEILLNQLGGLRYTPNSFFNGTDSFGWQASDGNAFSTTSQVRFAIGAVNDPPTVTDTTKAGQEDTLLPFSLDDFTAGFNDIDGDPLAKVQILTLPGNGTLRLNGTAIAANAEILATNLGNLTFQPNANFNGNVSFTWRGADAEFYSAGFGRLTLAIAPVNDEPTVSSFSLPAAPEGTTQFFNNRFTAAYSDIDNNPLAKIQITKLPDQGGLWVGSTPVVLNQELTPVEFNSLAYRPNPFYSGLDTFIWTGSDGLVYAATPATVNLTVTPFNDPPTLTNITGITVTEDTARSFTATEFTAAFSDPDGDNLSQIRITRLPNRGSLRLNGNVITANQEIPLAQLGNLTYVPNGNTTGNDSFEWNAADPSNAYAVAPATVSLTITGVNDLPVVSNISRSTLQDTPLVFSADLFTAAYSDIDNNPLTKIQITSLPSQGTLRLNGTPLTLNAEVNVADLGNVTFVPTAGYNGTDSFGWNGFDGVSYATNSALVNLSIGVVNARPLVSNITRTGTEDTPLSFSASQFTTGFSDPEGQSLSEIQITSLPTQGTLRLSGTNVTLNQRIVAAQVGSLTYTPNPNYNGSDSFDWNGSDGIAFALTGARVNLTLNPVNDAPTVGTVIKAGSEDASITFNTIDFASAFNDPDGDRLSRVRITTLPTNGSLLFDGTPVGVNQDIDAALLFNLRYVPNANYSGNENFGWNGSDGALFAATNGTVAIAILGDNDPPSIATSISTVSYARNAGAVVLDAAIAVTDPDSPTLASATIAILGFTPGGQEFLSFTNQNNIQGSFNGTTGVLSLTGVSTVENYRRALASVRYTHTNALLTNLPRLIQFSVSDGTQTSTSSNATLQLTFTNAAPVVDLNGAAPGVNFTTSGITGTVIPVVSPDLTLSDADGTTLFSASIIISNPINWTQERLTADTSGTAIASIFNPETGTLSLSGTASLADYQRVLRTITYSNQAIAPDAAVRTLLFLLNDGEDRSQTATTTLNLTLNPVLATPSTPAPSTPQPPAPTPSLPTIPSSPQTPPSAAPLPNSLQTTAASDRITAPDSDDIISSTMSFLLQDDWIDGGGGTDTFVLLDGMGNATVDVANSSNAVSGVFGNTVIRNFEQFNFSGFTGTLTALGSDTLNDVLIAGSGHDTLDGKQGNDTLIGNDGNDTLEGGLGSDRLEGGNGNDRYRVDSVNDVVVEAANGGIDEVMSVVDMNLGANLENLTLAGTARTATGNTLNNVLTGNASRNVLVGDLGNDTLVGNGNRDTLNGGRGNDRLMGGQGVDRLTGGLGRDTFMLTSARFGDRDLIADFNAPADTMTVSRSVVGRSIQGNRIRANQLVFGTRAGDRDDRFIYNQRTGALFFDRDGLGGAGQVQLAQLLTRPTITAADILIR